MHSLYVCLFSNGHIKVGRSIDPVGRIASHVERVSCVGIDLLEHHAVECVSFIVAAESALIQLCADSAASRQLNEWFTGLDFSEVCTWANECATRHYEQPKTDIVRLDGSIDFAAVIRALMAHGVTQTYMAVQCNCRPSAISNIVMRDSSEPTYSTGAKLLEMYARAIKEATKQAA